MSQFPNALPALPLPAEVPIEDHGNFVENHAADHTQPVRPLLRGEAFDKGCEDREVKKGWSSGATPELATGLARL